VDQRHIFENLSILRVNQIKIIMIIILYQKLFWTNRRPVRRGVFSAIFCLICDLHWASRRCSAEQTLTDTLCFRDSGRKMDMSEGDPLLLNDVPGLRTLFMTNMDPPENV